MSGLHHVRRALYSVPWAIQPDKLEAIAEVVEFNAAGGRLSREEIRARAGSGKAPPMQGAGIAVLPLYGIIGHRMNQVQDMSGPGGTSTEQFGQWFDSAMADDSIHAIVIDVDSPGGSVSGVAELADKIYRARGAKPIIAVANSLAASAAYWIATAADQLWVTPSGDVGSVGVYAMHIDESGLEAQMGVKTTLISAGEYKAEGNPHEPLNDTARAAMQERVDEIYGDFTGAIGKHRGVSVATVLARFGQGRIVGARKAVAAGMADTIGGLEDAIGALRAGASPRHTTRINTQAPGISLAFHQDTATGVAAPIVISPGSAELAKEFPMAGEISQAEKAAMRSNEVRQMCRDVGLSAEDTLRHIDSGMSVETIGALIMQDLRARHRTRGPISTVGGVLPTRFGGDGELGRIAHEVLTGAQGISRPIEMATPMDFARGIHAATQNVGSGPAGGFGVVERYETASFKNTSAISTQETAQRVMAKFRSFTDATVNVTVLDENSFVGGALNGRVTRIAEGATAAPKTVKLSQITLRAFKQGIYVDETSEADQDAPDAMYMIERQIVEAVNWYRFHDALIGDGVGVPLGITKSPAAMTVSKEVSQAADSITYANLTALIAALHPACMGDALFLANPSTLVQLMSLTIPIGDAGSHIPVIRERAGELTVLGIPLAFTDILPTIGNKGDILLWDPTQYLWTEVPRGEIERSNAPGWYQDVNSLRVLRRWGGQPAWKGAATGFDGRSYSCAAVLEDR